MRDSHLFKKVYVTVPKAPGPPEAPTETPRPKGPIKRAVVTKGHRRAQGTNGHWSFPEPIDPSIYIGFVYMIRDLRLKRAYIGKKQLVGTSVSNRNVESNWKIYVSSCEALRDAIASRGVHEFEFIILEQYRTKGTLSYAETWSLCRAEVPSSDQWYNTLVGKVSWKCTEPISTRHRERLDALLNNQAVPPGII